jgi:steroid 5-alpha reductase family enzyme
LLWSIRLGYFLFTRFLERGEDWRFVKARKHAGYHLFAWTMQGVWCFIQGLSLLMVNEYGKEAHQVNLLDVIGIAVWSTSLAVEALADQQKLDFVRQYPDRETRPFIQTGLWAYSRHPNFAGETGCWVGLFIMSCSQLSDNPLYLAASFAAPMWSLVFLQQTTVPWLEVLADRKYGGEAEYQRFKRETSEYWVLPKRPAYL